MLVVAAVIYYVYDPATMPFPRCPFLMLTGWQCPGCGSQRAIHSLLHLDVAAAWQYNALLVASIPYVLLLAVVEWCGRREGRLYRLLNSEVLIWSYFVLVVVWWVVRNIFGW